MALSYGQVHSQKLNQGFIWGFSHGAMCGLKCGFFYYSGLGLGVCLGGGTDLVAGALSAILGVAKNACKVL